MKKVLRKFTNYQQDDWCKLLPLVEFSLNNAVSSSTGYSPFYLFNGFEPRVFPDELSSSFSKNSSTSAHKLLSEIGANLEKAKESISNAQAEMLLHYNRKHTPAPPLKVGTSVWVNGEGITWPANSKRPNALQDPWLGPFPVTTAPDSRENLTVELPPSLARVDPVFHVSKIEPFIDNDPVEFPGRAQETPAPVVNKVGEYEAELESILDMRWHHGKVQVLCKYLGYPSAEAEWHTYEPSDPSWDDDRALVVQYQASHPPLAPPRKKVSKKVQAAKNRSPPASSSSTTAVQPQPLQTASFLTAHRRSPRLQI